MRLVAAVLMLGIGASASPVDSELTTQTPITMAASSSRTLPVANLSFIGNAQCDAKGDAFFYAGNGQTSLIYELLADGSHEVYGLVGEDARDNYYVAFRAEADGKLLLLGGERKSQRPVIFAFRDDPTSPTRTHLEAPPWIDTVNIRTFLQLRSGHFLIQGFAGKSAPAKDRERSYLAEFDSSGTLIRTVVDKDRSPVTASEWLSGASAVEGEDGFIYVLLPSRMLILSQTAKVVRKIRIFPPVPEYRPYQMYLSGRRLAIGYYKAGPPGLPATLMKIESLYTLVDASTGRQLRVYKPAPELENSPLICFSDEGFIFYNADKNGQIKLLTARAD